MIDVSLSWQDGRRISSRANRNEDGKTVSIKYYALAKDEEPPEEFCAVRHENGEPCDYRFYVPERTCKPHGEWERVSQTQEVRHLVCDCGEELGMEERGTLPWRYHHKDELPKYCPECGARIEVDE